MGKRGKLTSIKPAWVPLREAPFRFRATRNVNGDFSEGTSLDDLTATLTEFSRAEKAHIDIEAQRFRFTSLIPATVSGGHPWELLASGRRWIESYEVQIDPGIILDKNLKHLNDEERQVAEVWAIVLATGVVWEKTMVREFNIAVEAGQISIYARPSAKEPFQPVPPDVWPSYEIRDWAVGTAVSPDSSTLLSIHVAPTPTTRRGRVPVYDYDIIRGEVFRLLNSKSIPKLENDEGWRTWADLKRAVEPFCERLFKKIPADSTMDSFVDRAISEWNSRKQARSAKTG